MEKASELREMSDEQLELTLKEAAESLFRLRLQAETERSAAPSELRKARRLIARVKTIQGQRRLAAAAAAPAPVAPEPVAPKSAAPVPATKAAAATKETKPEAAAPKKATSEAKPAKASPAPKPQTSGAKSPQK